MKRRRGYFKHYNDAYMGDTLMSLSNRKEYLAICLFWTSLEIANSQDNEGKGEIDIMRLCSLYSSKTKTIMRSYHAITLVTPTFNCVLNGTKVCFEFSNYTEYQERRGQKKNKNSAKDVPIKDKRLKIKDKRLKIKESGESSAQKFENSFKFNLADIYQDYPRTEKRGESLMLIGDIVQGSEETFKELCKAVRNYTDHCKNRDQKYKYILTMPRFLEEWKDWLDPGNGKSNIESNDDSFEDCLMRGDFD